MKNNINIAQQGLNDLKNDVIGLCKNQDRFDLIVSVSENGTMDTITVTQFGAIQSNYCFPTSFGQVKIFPDGKNMNDMLEDPIGFNTFVESFNI